jgi:hypothetical protein
MMTREAIRALLTRIGVSASGLNPTTSVLLALQIDPGAASTRVELEIALLDVAADVQMLGEHTSVDDAIRSIRHLNQVLALASTLSQFSEHDISAAINCARAELADALRWA